jgi:hypothetical protein
MRAPTGRRQRGQSLPEFAIAICAFGFLLLALFQAILFYRAKATLDYATLEAARAGALHGVNMSDMQTGLARGIAPLYATATASPDKTGTFEAFGKALIAAKALATIKVVNPTPEAFDDFNETQWDNTKALPNDTLNFRPITAGSRSGISVQDANILKITVSFRYPLIVPVIDRMFGTLDIEQTALAGHEVYSMPILSGAEVRMQSPISKRANLVTAK